MSLGYSIGCEACGSWCGTTLDRGETGDVDGEMALDSWLVPEAYVKPFYESIPAEKLAVFAAWRDHHSECGPIVVCNEDGAYPVPFGTAYLLRIE